MSERIYAGTAKYNLIYIFAIYDDAHNGYLKIGEHTFDSASSYKQLPPNCAELQKHAHVRIKQYTKTALVQYELLHTELARKHVQLADGTIEQSSFRDSDVHEVLNRSGYDVHKFYDTGKDSEWYKVTLLPAIAAIRAVKEGRNVLTAAEKAGNLEGNAAPITAALQKRTIKLRDEQRSCINQTKRAFTTGDRMLWDCKMRFGKTVTAYSLVKEMKYQKVIVVTHRPAVVDGWRSDFDLIFDGDNRVFLTKSNIKESDRYAAEDASIDAENDRALSNLAKSGTPFVYFASMQDLRGSKLAGGKFDKNRGVFAMDWDIIIYDEAHEGTQTELGLSVQKLLEEPKAGKSPKKVLQLSGTPYNLLSQYEGENVYSWDYVQEQRAKKEWDEKHPGDHNPYADLPELRICTFDLREKLQNSYRYEDESIAFNFREFFRTWTGDPERDFRPLPAGTKVGEFVHKEDVRGFLDLISTESDDSNYPFATQEYRDMFRHTFWILPGVKEARAFSAMLKEHPVFKQFEVVNVAGDGDVEQPYDDALKAVRKAIKENPHTITLSCGKLTTGVTVKEWTGVMLLSGSSSTGAAGYMQTIFRVQSAGSIDGKQKSVCYAFDFAPDRTLKVLAEVHSLKKSAVGTDDGGRVQLGEFLNFCPVLAEGDTGMEFFDVPKMMRQLKKLTVDAAVKSGFDDDSIYKADAGIVMDQQKLLLVDLLNRRLTPQKKSKKQTSVSVNDQGLTDEQYKKAQDAKRKPKKERSKEELEALAKEREMRKKQQDLFNLLRNISIRLPLLIYGTATDFDESVRLTEFVDIVDEASWTEFMPKGVDKELFLKLLVFYDEDVIEGAGMRIRRLAKAADEMMPTQRVMRIAEIFGYFKNPAKETVLTPWRVVNLHMGDTIGGYNFYKEGYPEKDGVLEVPRLVEQGEVTSNLFLNENVRILEMNSKSGLYPLYIAYSIYRMLLPKAENELTLEEAQIYWQRALSEYLYVLCQTKMAVSITKRTLAGYNDYSVNAIYLTKVLERMNDQRRFVNKLTNPVTWGKEGERMKFDAVVGNPPYQEETGNTRKPPIYHYFYDTAFAIADIVSFISPGRFLFNAGQTPQSWNEKMLNDDHLKVVRYFANSKEVFDTVDIKGGIAITLRNAKANYGKIGTFTPHQQLSSILCKIDANSPDFTSLSTIISSRGHYRFTNSFFTQFPFAVERLGEGTGNMIASNAIELLPEAFTQTPSANGDFLQFVGRVNNNRVTSWIKREYVLPNEYTDSFNVILPEANGSGAFGETLSSPTIVSPATCTTDTFISIGAFETYNEAHAVLAYIKTKFARAILGIKKGTQHNPKSVWVYVPMQNFTAASDIDWSVPVAEIDRQLYKKYSLTVDEIEFIETMVKPMDDVPSIVD